MSWWLLSLAFAGEPLEGLEAYQEARLDVVERSVTMAYAKGYDGSGQFWFATQGGRTLSAADFAEAVGDTEAAHSVRATRRTLSAAGLGTLVLGVGAAALGVVHTASQERSGQPLSPAIVGSAFGAGAAGFVGGTLLLSRQMRWGHPSVRYTEEEARAQARQTNGRLRDELLGSD